MGWVNAFFIFLLSGGLVFAGDSAHCPGPVEDCFTPADELQLLWNVRNWLLGEFESRSPELARLGKGGAKKTIDEILRTKWNEPSMPLAKLRCACTRTYDMERIKTLPGFRPEDLLSELHVRRAYEIYAALGRYGQENEAWYRVSALDVGKDAFVFPPDILRRMIRRGLLSIKDAKDEWGRMFEIREEKEPRLIAGSDLRLRLCRILSLGEDGEADTADDLSFHQGPPDGGYRKLAGQLGADPSP
jgi:hypothetical protein